MSTNELEHLDCFPTKNPLFLAEGFLLELVGD